MDGVGVQPPQFGVEPESEIRRQRVEPAPQTDNLDSLVEAAEQHRLVEVVDNDDTDAGSGSRLTVGDIDEHCLDTADTQTPEYVCNPHLTCKGSNFFCRLQEAVADSGRCS